MSKQEPDADEGLALQALTEYLLAGFRAVGWEASKAGGGGAGERNLAVTMVARGGPAVELTVTVSLTE